MKRLFFLALFAIAAWYGWHNYRSVFQRHDMHEAVIRNDSSSGLERVRLKVDGQTMVKEVIASGQSVTFPFQIANDSDFHLTWDWNDKPGQLNWTGGLVAKGPLMQRHVFTIDGDGEVIYHAEAKTSAPTGK